MRNVYDGTSGLPEKKFKTAVFRFNAAATDRLWFFLRFDFLLLSFLKQYIDI